MARMDADRYGFDLIVVNCGFYMSIVYRNIVIAGIAHISF